MLTIKNDQTETGSDEVKEPTEMASLILGGLRNKTYKQIWTFLKLYESYPHIYIISSLLTYKDKENSRDIFDYLKLALLSDEKEVQEAAEIIKYLMKLDRGTNSIYLKLKIAEHVRSWLNTALTNWLYKEKYLSEDFEKEIQGLENTPQLTEVILEKIEIVTVSVAFFASKKIENLSKLFSFCEEKEIDYIPRLKSIYSNLPRKLKDDAKLVNFLTTHETLKLVFRSSIESTQKSKKDNNDTWPMSSPPQAENKQIKHKEKSNASEEYAKIRSTKKPDPTRTDLIDSSHQNGEVSQVNLSRGSTK